MIKNLLKNKYIYCHINFLLVTIYPLNPTSNYFGMMCFKEVPLRIDSFIKELQQF